MIIFTEKEATKLFEGNEGREVLSYIVKQGAGKKEYLSDGLWVDKPLGKIRGSRYNFNGWDKEIENIIKIWNYLKSKSSQIAVRGDEIIRKIINSQLKKEELVFFSPWGPRYNRKESKIDKEDLEIRTLKEIEEIFKEFNLRDYKINFILMPADVYGTEINNLPEQFVSNYFSYLGDLARLILGSLAKISIAPWSKIRTENREKYEKLKREIDNRFFDFIKGGEYEKAFETACFFNCENEQRAKMSARKYCIERLVEGNIISEVYDPIKLSLVRKEKDALDGPLRRIYIIKNKAPWMGG